MGTTTSVLVLLPSEFEPGDRMTAGGSVVGGGVTTDAGVEFTLLDVATGLTTTRAFNPARKFAIVRGRKAA